MLPFPYTPKHTPQVGAYTGAKLDFLGTARDRIDPETGKGQICVNRMYCRPLHPHGQKMVQDGLMTIAREGLGKCRHTFLTITQKGLDELDRLEKIEARRARKHGMTDLAEMMNDISRRKQLSTSAIRGGSYNPRRQRPAA